MGEQISVPNGDGAPTNWTKVPPFTTFHYQCINENWSTPFTGIRLDETANYQNFEVTFPADGPTAMATVHTMHVDLYIKTTDIAQLPGVGIYMFLGATYHTHRLFSLDTSGAWVKKRFTITGLSLTKAQYNTVEIQVMTFPGNPGWPTPVTVP